MGMIKTVIQAWKIPEIRSKMIFTLLMLLVYRIGSNIPVPNINRAALSELFTGETGLFDLFDLFSGGSFSNFTIFALSITPYITASIIVQLLTMAFPYFENLARQGVEGRKKMAQITRYMTVVLAVIQAVGLTVGLFRRAVIDKSVFSIIVVILVLTAGTAFLMWLGEQINEKGVGNGISLLIFAGIVDRIPSAIRSIYTQYTSGNMTLITIILLVIAAILVIAGVVLIQSGDTKRNVVIVPFAV
jgi:preprotein translocase subunit SecY